MTQHMRESTVQNQNKPTLGKARQIQSCLNRGGGIKRILINRNLKNKIVFVVTQIARI